MSATSQEKFVQRLERYNALPHNQKYNDVRNRIGMQLIKSYREDPSQQLEDLFYCLFQPIASHEVQKYCRRHPRFNAYDGVLDSKVEYKIRQVIRDGKVQEKGALTNVVVSRMYQAITHFVQTGIRYQEMQSPGNDTRRASVHAWTPDSPEKRLMRREVMRTIVNVADRKLDDGFHTLFKDMVSNGPDVYVTDKGRFATGRIKDELRPDMCPETIRSKLQRIKTRLREGLIEEGIGRD